MIHCHFHVQIKPVYKICVVNSSADNTLKCHVDGVVNSIQFVEFMMVIGYPKSSLFHFYEIIGISCFHFLFETLKKLFIRSINYTDSMTITFHLNFFYWTQFNMKLLLIMTDAADQTTSHNQANEKKRLKSFITARKLVTGKRLCISFQYFIGIRHIFCRFRPKWALNSKMVSKHKQV